MEYSSGAGSFQARYADFQKTNWWIPSLFINQLPGLPHGPAISASPTVDRITRQSRRRSRQFIPRRLELHTAPAYLASAPGCNGRFSVSTAQSHNRISCPSAMHLRRRREERTGLCRRTDIAHAVDELRRWGTPPRTARRRPQHCHGLEGQHLHDRQLPREASAEIRLQGQRRGPGQAGRSLAEDN